MLLDTKTKQLLAGALIAGSLGLVAYFLPKSKHGIKTGILSNLKKKQQKAGKILKKIASKKGTHLQNATETKKAKKVKKPSSKK